MAEAILLAQRTATEVRALLATNAVVLVPIGAQEQHGPGIALSTDTIAADALCRRAAALLGERAAVAPAIPYGVSWHHLAFPGTLSLSSATLTSVLAEIAGSLARHGFPRVVFVNGHGGNSAPLRPGLETLGLYGYAILAEGAAELLPAEALGHGGGDEAAVVLAAAPDYARPDAFAAPEPIEPRATLNARLRPYGAVAAVPYEEQTRNGVTGDTRPATAAIGERILERGAATLAELLEAFIAATPRGQ